MIHAFTLAYYLWGPSFPIPGLPRLHLLLRIATDGSLDTTLPVM
jgi:hypothetical protein